MKKVMLLSIICFWMLSAIGDCAKVQIADYGAQPFMQRYSEYIDSDSNFRTGKIGIAFPEKRNLDSSFDALYGCIARGCSIYYRCYIICNWIEL